MWHVSLASNYLTTLSKEDIFSQIAAKDGLKVLAIDLAPQRNLSETLKLSSSLFPLIGVRSALSDKFREEDYSLYIIDTHPTIDKSVLEAINFSEYCPSSSARRIPQHSESICSV
jgi:cellulose biosynthesis protein BcsQ